MSLRREPEASGGTAMASSSGPVGAANKINRALERAMPFLSPAGVLMGVLLPSFFLGVRPAIPWLFGTITLAGALKLRAKELGKAASSPLPILLFFFSAHILMPLAVFLLSGLVFRGDADTVSGYVLLYSVPTAVTAFIWVTIYRGDLALSLSLIMLDTLLAPLVVPWTVRLLVGTSVSLDMTGMTVSLIFMVAIPTIIGVVLNEASGGKIPSLVGPYISPLSKICMVTVVAANSAAVAPQIRFSNPRMWLIIAVCVAFSTLGFILGKITGLPAKLKGNKQTTFFFAVGLRNTSAAMTLGIEFFPPAAALPSVLGIMSQQSTAAIMSRFLLGRVLDDEKNEKKPAGGNGNTGEPEAGHEKP